MQNAREHVAGSVVIAVSWLSNEREGLFRQWQPTLLGSLAELISEGLKYQTDRCRTKEHSPPRCISKNPLLKTIEYALVVGFEGIQNPN